MEEYLFLVSIGPVQSFIASARRSRDLWFGSTLLSELARAAAAQIVKSNSENTLIFPSLSSEDLQAPHEDGSINVTNKIVALIHQSPQELAAKVEIAMFKRLNELKTLAFQALEDHDFNREMANAQIADLVEYLWVALPFVENDYKNIRNKLEALMAARKNTRDFAPVTWGGTEQKSSIDGQLESVIPENKYPRRGDDDQKRQQKVRFLYRRYKASPAERLSGVDLLKRLGRLSENISASSVLTSFPSTSHIAAMPYLQRLDALNKEEKGKAKTLWEKYVGQLQLMADTPDTLQEQTIPPHWPKHSVLGSYDGSLLFEERWVDLVSDVNSIKKGEKAVYLKQAKEALGEFFRFVEKCLGPGRPNPYYAILLADGDRMGKAIDEQAKRGYKAHQSLSLALSEFAGNVRPIVEDRHPVTGQYQGALVYAGGDDVLAFMPLHIVLKQAQTLHKTFGEKLEPFKDEKDHPPTLSAGIVIMHHLTSLKEALDLARQAEKRAKNIPDKKKNALAITISKRSGDDYTIAGHWGELDNYLVELIGFYSTDDIPAGTAYELRDLALRLTTSVDSSAGSEARKEVETLREAMLKEAERLLKRKLKLGVPQSKRGQHDAKRLEEIEQVLLERLRTKTQKSDDPSVSISLEQFSHELVIAQVLADAEKLAKGAQ